MKIAPPSVSPVLAALGRLVVLSASLSLAAGPALAQAKTPPVQGTTQQAGHDAVPGQTFTLFAGQSNALNLTLRSAEYSVGHYLYDNDLKDGLRGAGKKLLVLHLTVQNPQKSEVYVRGDSVKFTAVDSKNLDLPGEGAWYDEKTHAEIAMQLKPAQKIDVFTAIEVDADASVPKLIVDDADGRVWRYDLRGRIAPLPAPFADPGSRDGSVALDVVPARTGVAYPGPLDLTATKFEYAAGPLGGLEVPEGGRLLVVYATLRNPLKANVTLYGGLLQGALIDQDGLSSENRSDALLASRDRVIEGEIVGGKDLAVRLVFAVEADLKPQKLRLNVTDGRVYEFDVSGLK